MHTLCTPSSFRLPSARRNIPVCSVDGAFSLHSTNGRKLKSRQKALLPRPSDGYRVQNKNASIVSILTFLYGGEKGIRTLDTVPRIHDFQSCALDQLSHLSTAAAQHQHHILYTNAGNFASLFFSKTMKFVSSRKQRTSDETLMLTEQSIRANGRRLSKAHSSPRLPQGRLRRL